MNALFVDEPKTKRFTKPTPEQVTEYSKSIGFDIDGDEFCVYYDMCGWVVGKACKPMKSWKKAVEYWKNNQKKHTEITPKKTKIFPISGKVCCKKGCCLPAVYKDGKGAYDSYYCAEHMPESVKRIYTA